MMMRTVVSMVPLLAPEPRNAIAGYVPDVSCNFYADFGMPGARAGLERRSAAGPEGPAA